MRKKFFNVLALPLFALSCEVFSYDINTSTIPLVNEDGVNNWVFGYALHNMRNVVQANSFTYSTREYGVRTFLSDGNQFTVREYIKNGKIHFVTKHYRDTSLILEQRNFDSNFSFYIYYYTSGSVCRYVFVDNSNQMIVNAVSFTQDGIEEGMIKSSVGSLAIRNHDGILVKRIYQDIGQGRYWEKLYDPDTQALKEEYALRNGVKHGPRFVYDQKGLATKEIWEDGKFSRNETLPV